MPVYEIKETGTNIQVRPKPRRNDIAPAFPVIEGMAIGPLLPRQEGAKERNKREKREAVYLSPAKFRDIKRLTEQVNSNLTACGIEIHLLLVKNEEGYILDVYDCSSGSVCEIIHDMTIRVDDLPALLARLQQEVGIMFDKRL